MVVYDVYVTQKFLQRIFESSFQRKNCLAETKNLLQSSSRYVSIADEEERHISQSKDAWEYTSWNCVVVLAYEIEYI